MKQSKMLDLFKASNEEAGKVTLETILPAIVKEYGDCVVSEGVAVLTGEMIGAVCPRINNIWLGYKQRRLERNLTVALNQIKERQTEIEEQIMMLHEKNESYLNSLVEIFLDHIVDEIQMNKVEYNVQGYINLLKSDNTNEDVALMFFSTLSQLSDLDIRILKLYSADSLETFQGAITDLKLSYEQQRLVKEKLERFGLLQSKNEEIHENNLELIVKYLQTVEKEKKKSRPKEIPLPKMKKVTNTDSYKITSLGRNFLQLLDV